VARSAPTDRKNRTYVIDRAAGIGSYSVRAPGGVFWSFPHVNGAMRTMSPGRDPWLITRLFDLSFTRFVALSLIRIVYVLAMVGGVGLLAYIIIDRFMKQDNYLGILLLVTWPVIYLVYLVVIRLICETLIVVFAMAEHLEDIREELKRPDGTRGPQE
jgi:hypothetical protein